MKSLYAIYDRKDNFIDCDYGYKNILRKKTFLSQYEKKQKQMKICKIPLEIQDDVFQEEDEIFISEEQTNVFTGTELAKMLGVSRRTVWRRKKEAKKRPIEDLFLLSAYI